MCVLISFLEHYTQSNLFHSGFTLLVITVEISKTKTNTSLPQGRSTDTVLNDIHNWPGKESSGKFYSNKLETNSLFHDKVPSFFNWMHEWKTKSNIILGRSGLPPVYTTNKSAPCQYCMWPPLARQACAFILVITPHKLGKLVKCSASPTSTCSSLNTTMPILT